MKILGNVTKKLTSFYNKVSGQFKKPQVDSSSINEKNIIGIQKCCKFEDNFDYEYYMENKEKIDAIKKLGVLVTKIRDYTISKEEFLEYKELLVKWTSINVDEYTKMINNLSFTEEELIDKLKKYSEITHNERMLIETFIGSVSGATMTAQINFVKEYKFKKDGKNKSK